MTGAVEQAAWRLFIENSARLQTELDRRLKPQGLCMADYHVLLLLHEAPDRRLRMHELSRAMVYSPSRLSYQIGSLCRRGWVRRENAAEDRRGSYAVLTAAGAAAFAAAARSHGADVEELFFSVITDDDAAVLSEIMTRLADRLDHRESR